MDSREIIWMDDSNVFKLFKYFGCGGVMIPSYKLDDFHNVAKATGLNFVCRFNNTYEKHNQWLSGYRSYYIFEICDRIKWFLFILKSGISYESRPTITQGWEIIKYEIPYKVYQHEC